MFSDLFYQLIEENIFLIGIFETLYMTIISSIIAYIIGLPLGIILTITDENGLTPNKWINRPLSIIINFFRSIPFVVLMVAMLPISKFIIGTSLGNGAMIIMLIIAAVPYIARVVETSLKEVDSGVIEAARSMGANDFEIIVKVLLKESMPSLILGATLATISILGYSAMASTIGGTGLGQIAIIYGHQRSNSDITWLCVILITIIVISIQEIGNLVVKRVDKRKKI